MSEFLLPSIIPASMLSQADGTTPLSSWQFLIQCLTWDILIACILWSIGRRILKPNRAEQKGIPTSGFTWADNTVALCMCLCMLLVNVSTFAIFAMFILFRMFTPPVREMYSWKLPSAVSTIVWIVGISLVIRLGTGLMEESGLMEWICNRTGAPEEQAVIKALRTGDAEEQMRIAFSAILLAPLLEEICFRGYLYPILKRYIPAICANIGVSFFFAFVHNSLGQALPLALIGFLLTICYERTRTLLVPIMAHAVFNATTIAYLLIFGTS
ncbi:CPBP family intramembrane glutamic endopeptidase [Akkermansia glycaniphila]|uniref:Caax protease self-immunity n=1 Tax=Akkermansia glycaniphila TaxID=1679444 RepID=A0A1C7PCT6_9BACT|nr:CPBP family intramembrane glutamic endopeptidase [Akkermansia glycaniphila]MBT9449575.1 CPBP family intramembrane metalloprotease [Akkermansia glycaniphila]OCA03194.1 hypothetical protein AC781_05770 [Akkermansia glycaniphila]SEI01606.1 caax protease self-immunity [Akkermansia glycaniphila]